MLLYRNKGVLEAGVDEAGRGSLIGPVCVGAVIWDPSKIEEAKEIKDSKKLSRKKRERLAEHIKEHAVAWATAYGTAEEIDEVNILQSTMKTMHRAIHQLDPEPESLLIDGNYFKPIVSKYPEDPDLPDVFNQIQYECVKGGDAKYISIAAASILAKVEHDRMIKALIEQHEDLKKYDLEKNMGYGTKKHYEALSEHGPSQFHRKSFNLKLSSDQWSNQKKNKILNKYRKSDLEKSDLEKNNLEKSDLKEDIN